MGKKFKKNLVYLGLGLVLLFNIPGLLAQQIEPQAELPSVFRSVEFGRFEIGVHFSTWTLDIIKGSFEGRISDELGDEISNEVAKELRRLEYPIYLVNYAPDFLFDSGGHNYGLEMRYYPQGRQGSFSLGFSIEKATMRLKVDGSMRTNFNDGTYATVDALGEIVLNPIFSILSFRWDFIPSWRITPFFVMGLGVAAMKGEFNFEYSGTYKSLDPDVIISDSQAKVLKEWEEESSVNFPNILPLLQLNLGVRAIIMPNLNFKVEAGFWDGFILRAGVSGRF